MIHLIFIPVIVITLVALQWHLRLTKQIKINSKNLIDFEIGTFEKSNTSNFIIFDTYWFFWFILSILYLVCDFKIGVIGCILGVLIKILTNCIN